MFGSASILGNLPEHRRKLIEERYQQVVVKPLIEAAILDEQNQRAALVVELHQMQAKHEKDMHQADVEYGVLLKKSEAIIAEQVKLAYKLEAARRRRAGLQLAHETRERKLSNAIRQLADANVTAAIYHIDDAITQAQHTWSSRGIGCIAAAEANRRVGRLRELRSKMIDLQTSALVGEGLQREVEAAASEATDLLAARLPGEPAPEPEIPESLRPYPASSGRL